MKAILEFNLDDPDDNVSHLQCVNAKSMVSCIWDITQRFRGIEKYGERETLNISEVREIISGIMSEYNIDLDRLA